MTKKGQAIAKLSAVPLTRRNEDGVFSSRRMRRHAEKEKKKEEKSLKKKTGNMGKAMNNQQRKAQAKKKRPKRVQLKDGKGSDIKTSTGKEVKHGDKIHSGEFKGEEGLIMFPEQIHEDFKGIVVQPPHEPIINGIESWQKKEHPRYKVVSSNSVPDDNPDMPPHWVGIEKHTFDGKVCLENIKKELTQYGRQGLIDMDIKSKEWQNWCDDVCCYFTLRFVLTEEPMPICPTSAYENVPDDHFEDEEAMADEGVSKSEQFPDLSNIIITSPLSTPLPEEEAGERRVVSIRPRVQGCDLPSKPTYNTGDLNDID